MRWATSFEDARHILFIFTAAVCLNVGYWIVHNVFSVRFPSDVDIMDRLGIPTVSKVNPAVPDKVINVGNKVHLAINSEHLHA